MDEKQGVLVDSSEAGDAPGDQGPPQELSLDEFLDYAAAMSDELARLADAFGQGLAARHLRLASLTLSGRKSIGASMRGRYGPVVRKPRRFDS